ncbi:protein ZAR1-like [Danio rerio]|uniref:ZAR1-like protein n=1 Tax=Danio rerio TaxID=7955 RepID=E5LCR6_DANRE|nr:ZAR1-like protein [Danio rerio]ADP09341.1 zygote arrest 1-like protein [Danio rerio]|eukprot:NP_001186296.1 ZAR1-like protein [Danio rerio]
MEDFIIPPYNCGRYPGYFPFYPSNAKFKHQNWNKKGNNFYIAPDAPDYFDVYKRAQLKAILSQVNPNLTPRLRKANTKEFGVQVNPKVDAVIQCSLGPKTLFYRGDKWDSPRKPYTVSPLKDTLPNTPVNSVRFSRPVAIYSPVFDRRIFSLSTTAGESKDDGKEEDRKTDSETEDEDDDEFCKPDEKTHDESRHEKSLIQRDKRSNFQFLEQKYGFYHCSKCNIRWESAFVWCISGTSKVYFKQHCRKCQAGLNPYRVESIQCQVCCKARCCCERKQRHIDMRRPHRQDLCGRCKGKGLSCDTIYSFKYIV